MLLEYRALDGGRIVTALSRWLWIPGLAVLVWFGWKFPNFIVWLMVFQLAAVGSQAPTALNWMAHLGPWNYAIAFAFMITGLLLTMRWH